MGRPTTLSGDLIRRISDLILQGNYALVSARASGVPERTFATWLQRGRRERDAEQSTVYVELVEAIEEATARSHTEAVAKLMAALPEDWRAVIAYLERRFSAEWKPRGALEVEQVAFGDDDRSDEEIEAEARRILTTIWGQGEAMGERPAATQADSEPEERVVVAPESLADSNGSGIVLFDPGTGRQVPMRGPDADHSERVVVTGG